MSVQLSTSLAAEAIGSWADAMLAIYRALGWYPLDPAQGAGAVVAQLAVATATATEQVALPQPWRFVNAAGDPLATAQRGICRGVYPPECGTQIFIFFSRLGRNTFTQCMLRWGVGFHLVDQTHRRILLRLSLMMSFA